MTTVAQQYPVRVQSNGTAWYRPARRAGENISQWGWTSDPEQADPSYAATAATGMECPWPMKLTVDAPPTRVTRYSREQPAPGSTPTTTKDTAPMTALTDDGEFAPRATEWMGYPLPPAAPRFTPKFNGWKQYVLPSPSTGRPTGFPRATTIADVLDDTYGLSRWKRRETVKYVLKLVQQSMDPDIEGRDDAALRLDQLLNAIETGVKVGEIDTVLDLIDNENGGAESREFGTCVHAWLEALDIGQVLYTDVPEMVRPHVDAYQDVLGRFGLVPVPEYVERLVLNDRGAETVVGCIDRIYRVVATGELVMGDVKTSKSLEYSWVPFGVQIGGVYAGATHMISTDGTTWEPMPQIRGDFAILMHVPSDQPERSAAITIDIPWGAGAMQESIAVRALRREAKKIVPQHAIPVPTPDSIRYAQARMALSRITTAEEGQAVYEAYEDVWDDDLGEYGEAIAALL